LSAGNGVQPKHGKTGMLQAFIITLREGVEAALIVGIVFAYLDKIDRRELKQTVFYALGCAIAASVGVAIVISHLNFNEDIFEGWVMLVAAAFVIGMIWFMHKTARTMRGDIESKVSKLIGSKFGLFGFVFLMVLREGVETVLILAGVSLNSTELMSFTGTLLGIASAVVFGVMFIRGSVRINLHRFFRVTTVILYFVVFQLVASGLHELSENGVIRSSQAEMRYIGPIVRNDLFFFVTMLALAGLMVLFEYKRRTPVVIPSNATPADRRKAEYLARREKLWMNAVVAVSFVFIFLSTAEFIYAQGSTRLSEATPVTLIGSQVTVPTSEVTDNKLHRYSVHIDGADRKSTEVRFLLFKKPDGNLVSVADACHICGPVGFYIGEQGITCKMCSSPLVASSMGQPGGCNPIPLKSTIEGGQIVIAKADLQPLTAIFGGK